MTAAQKQNQKRFKAAQLEAKKLRLKNPKLSHRDALKQAFAIEYKTIGAAKKPKIKKEIVKKTVKKTVAKKNVKKIKKPHTHWGTIHAHKRRVNGIKRPGEKSVLKSIEHAAKVQKIHMGIGASVREMSQIQMVALKDALERLFYAQQNLDRVKIALSKSKKMGYSPAYKKELTESVKMYKQIIKELNTHIKEIKKHIK